MACLKAQSAVRNVWIVSGHLSPVFSVFKVLLALLDPADAFLEQFNMLNQRQVCQ